MRYLVENARPRKIVTLFGKVLASAVSSKKNEPGQLWLSAEQFRSEQVQGLIKSGKLSLKMGMLPVGSDVTVFEPDRVVGIPTDVIMMDEMQHFDHVATDVVTEVATDVVTELATIEPPGPAQSYTEEELKARLLPELRSVCSSLRLDPRGNKDVLIERILLSQVST